MPTGDEEGLMSPATSDLLVYMSPFLRAQVWSGCIACGTGPEPGDAIPYCIHGPVWSVGMC